jgi:hypothetical protein
VLRSADDLGTVAPADHSLSPARNGALPLKDLVLSLRLSPPDGDLLWLVTRLYATPSPNGLPPSL